MIGQRIIIGIAALLALSGCSVIMGTGDEPGQQGMSFRFQETLRNEASLRGESFKETAYSTDRATTLQQPNQVVADAFRVYVADASPARVFVFERGDRRVAILDGVPPPAVDEVKLLAPAGIAVDPSGFLYVADSQQARIFVYERNGKLLRTIGAMGELARPGGLAFDAKQNRLYAVDTFAHRVKVYSLTGDFLYDIGASGKSEQQAKFPGAIALDRDGSLLVLDTLKKAVFRYGADGTFQKSLGLTGPQPGAAIQPKALAVDSRGHVYVTDAASNNILLFDRDGAFLFTWGRTGSRAGEFQAPAGIFIDPQDTIYVADQYNGRVQVYQYIP
jgi:DNA-binding beta-propeller fold protein YncE